MKNTKVNCLVLLVFLLAAAAGSRAEDIDNYKNEIQQKNKNLDEIKSKIKEKNQQSEKLKVREKGISAELARINGELAKIQADINKLNKKIVQVQKDIDFAHARLIAKRAASIQTQNLLRRHLYILYKYQRANLEYLPIILSNAPYEQLVRNDKYLRVITGQNTSLYQQIKQQEADILIVETDLKAKESQLEELQGQVRAQEEVAVKQQQLKASLLAQVREQRQSTEDEIAQLKKESSDLQHLVDKFRSKVSHLEKEKAAAAKNKKREYVHKKASLDWLLAGPVISNFGKQKNAELNAFVINNGIEIKAAAGTEARAIDQGSVLYANTFKSYGLMVIIDHGDDFYTVYAHLGMALVKEGDKVLPGQVIGKVGSGKNGHTAIPNLYFEIRQDGKPEDPLLWLK